MDSSHSVSVGWQQHLLVERDGLLFDLGGGLAVGHDSLRWNLGKLAFKIVASIREESRKLTQVKECHSLHLLKLGPVRFGRFSFCNLDEDVNARQVVLLVEEDKRTLPELFSVHGRPSKLLP